jgi:hypothetical protein
VAGVGDAMERTGSKGDDHHNQQCPREAEWSSPAAAEVLEIDDLWGKSEFDRRSAIALGFERAAELLGQAADQLQA